MTDSHLPEIDGYALINQLRHKPDSIYTAVPVILMATNPDATSVQKAMQAGASHYLAKPFDVMMLRQKILDVYAKKTPAIYNKHKCPATPPVAQSAPPQSLQA